MSSNLCWLIKSIPMKSIGRMMEYSIRFHVNGNHAVYGSGFLPQRKLWQILSSLLLLNLMWNHLTCFGTCGLFSYWHNGLFSPQCHKHRHTSSSGSCPAPCSCSDYLSYQYNNSTSWFCHRVTLENPQCAGNSIKGGQWCRGGAVFDWYFCAAGVYTTR